MKTQNTRRILPLASNPCAPYGAQGLDASVLIWRHDQHHPIYRFGNPFQTPISVVDWSQDGSVLLAGSMTGEVLAWRFRTREMLLANRHAHSYAPIRGISWSPGAYALVALTMTQTIQIWQVATRECLLVLPCQRCTTTLTWSLDGSGFRTNDGVAWAGREGGYS